MRTALTATALFLAATAASAQPALIPAPRAAAFADTGAFAVTSRTPIVVPDSDGEVLRVAEMLAGLIGPGVGVTHPDSLDVQPVVEVGAAREGAISLRIVADARHGAEGYALRVDARGVRIEASHAAGLFYGVQTLRQVMPPEVEYEAARLREPVRVPFAEIEDAPRYPWRGSMLDVARHFHPVETVERYLDLMALYKMNRLHLHLSDDQGWRIEIPGWPRLTTVGASSEVGGGPGGFYTLEDYDRIVRYASDRFITIVPEIDVPGHIHAALVAYPELSCDGEAREPYTGIRVGFSALCVENERTYEFLGDVFETLADHTPGEWLHVGGDEVKTLAPEQYAHFMQRVEQIVAKHGKRTIAWDEAVQVDIQPRPILQLWRPFLDGLQSENDATRARAEALASAIADATRKGGGVILSPADRIYLDIKYDADSPVGHTWAGFNGVRDAYDWGASPWLDALPEGAVLGMEAPLWTETVATLADIEAMAFPRLPGVAERGWSPPEALVWETYRPRLAAHAARWHVLGVNYTRSPEVWE